MVKCIFIRVGYDTLLQIEAKNDTAVDETGVDKTLIDKSRYKLCANLSDKFRPLEPSSNFVCQLQRSSAASSQCHLQLLPNLLPGLFLLLHVCQDTDGQSHLQ